MIKGFWGGFSALKGIISGYKARPMEKIDKSICEKQVGNLVDSLNGGEESDMRKAVRSALHASMKKTKYYLDNMGEVYVRT